MIMIVDGPSSNCRRVQPDAQARTVFVTPRFGQSQDNSILLNRIYILGRGSFVLPGSRRMGPIHTSFIQNLTLHCVLSSTSNSPALVLIGLSPKVPFHSRYRYLQAVYPLLTDPSTRRW
jgi:hypothetical protein